MKNHISSLFSLSITALAVFPAIAMALPPSTSPYNTDVTNSYVQDQTSEVMSQLNNILCYMGAMAPDQMVNLSTDNGNYIALIDKNICETKGSGGQSNNTGAAYEAATVNSSRASTSDPMLVKVWVAPEPGKGTLAVYASATQEPNTTTLPYGIFRMDYCGGGSPCTNEKGFINATSSGLSFFQTHSDPGFSGTTALKLNATGSGSTAAGDGAISQTYTSTMGSGGSDFKFAYNANYFVRDDGITGDLCFDRNPANAAESVWRYGLYDATTGAQITRKSGFPIEYTDTSVTPNVTYNGYVGYYGMWMPVTVPSGATVNQVTYSNSGPTKTPYTLYTTGGKLMKFTTANKTLADLNKITFWYFAQAAIGTGMPSSGQYELFWDDATGQFMVSGKQNMTSNNMESYATPVAIESTASASNAAMLFANQWGLFGWSQMMGGMFGINGIDFANLTSTTPATVSAIPVKVQTQDIVYPSQFAALGSLKCINDCPTAALIGSSNAVVPPATQVSPFVNPGWTPVASTAFYTYTLDGTTTGNMFDLATTPAAVVSTATTGYNSNGIMSGRLVTVADAATIVTRKNTACGNCNQFNQGDVDLLDVGASYYQWQTGGNPWNQIAYLMSQASTPVLEVFDAPLQVSFVVPAGAKYGNFAGSIISMQYGGFGDLWGIPNECIDVTTNAACTFGTSGTAQNNQRWTSKFSIPFDATTGVVTVSGSATTYLVKPLDKEVRLAKVACSGTSLPATASLTAVTLPGAADFIDPIAAGKVSATPPTFTTVPAPQVIHGIKQY